ncbi:ABC transporter substrate-binding protein [Sedimentibacter sp.]|uniref:ABC transporter substrate-binding protein n=1 Tax=Sedimentibacter sp. TaxID=1960295 RepID=UPI0028A67BC8|nr:ABC transporter substrate-binding protein [Sedimentibacter sp.]
MKLNIKKYMAMVLLVPVIMTGCQSEEANSPQEQDSTDNSYKIGISQLMEHPSLDQSREGFVDRLKELGLDVQIDYVNSQGDVNTVQAIAEKFVKDKADMIYAIATPPAQAARQATKDTGIPVLFSAVTDPVFSQIVDGLDKIDNVTGLSNKVEPLQILKSVKNLKEEINVIGIIYNIGESNSEIQVKEVTAAAEELGMTVETAGITSANDIPQAINTLEKKIDVLYIVSDNTVASSIQLVANLCIEKKIMTVSIVESQIEDGILMVNGLNYYDHGRQAADMAKAILVDKKDIKDVHVGKATVLNKKVNLKTMEILGLTRDNEAFEGAEFIED